jgi:hypothetical protein
MKIKLKLDDPETRAIWETVQRAKAEVASWPAWKRGEEVSEGKPEATDQPGSAPATQDD